MSPGITQPCYMLPGITPPYALNFAPLPPLSPGTAALGLLATGALGSVAYRCPETLATVLPLLLQAVININ